MSRVRTSYVPLRELTLGEDAARVWLSPVELALFHTMRSPVRQDTFLAGRILAKRLLMGSLSPGLAARELAAKELVIESRSETPGHGERPVLSIGGALQPVSLSIAHSGRGVLAACLQSFAGSIGVDLAERDAVDDRLRWTFTQAERAWLAAHPSPQIRAAELWARKEALYKACQRGEGFRPAAIEVVPNHCPVYPHLDGASELSCLQTWRVDGHVAALAIAPPRPEIATQVYDTTSRAA